MASGGSAKAVLPLCAKDNQLKTTIQGIETEIGVACLGIGVHWLPP